MVAGVRRSRRFNQKKMDFFTGHGAVFDAFRDDIHFAGVQGDGFISQFDIKGALEDEEEIIGVFVAVPDEFTLGFHHHDIAVVVLGDGAGGEVIGESAELFGEVYFGLHNSLHGRVSSDGWNSAYVAKSGWSGQVFSPETYLTGVRRHG